MTSPTPLDEQRLELRHKMQLQRNELKTIFNLTPSDNGDNFPRSMTFRLLTGKSTLLMVILMKALPLLLRLRK
ncbi:MAG: hypothetical protein EA373_08510 [Oceanospirillales bacterium]|nr:MAG: hypothetical protein EA373_08510 [Oceanospirillales bacterium]